MAWQRLSCVYLAWFGLAFCVCKLLSFIRFGEFSIISYSDIFAPFFHSSLFGSQLQVNLTIKYNLTDLWGFVHSPTPPIFLHSCFQFGKSIIEPFEIAYSFLCCTTQLLSSSSEFFIPEIAFFRSRMFIRFFIVSTSLLRLHFSTEIFMHWKHVFFLLH